MWHIAKNLCLHKIYIYKEIESRLFQTDFNRLRMYCKIIKKEIRIFFNIHIFRIFHEEWIQFLHT